MAKKDLWPQEKKAIKATQVAFDISTEAQHCIKQEALDNEISPSDQMRRILGLPVKKPVRPRLTISLSVADYEMLGEKYGVSPADRLAIKEKAAQVLIEHVKDKHGEGQ